MVLLTRPRPAHQLAAFLIRCMGFSIGFGLAIVFALHGSRVLRHPDPTVTAIVEVAVGAVLVVVAVVAIRPHLPVASAAAGGLQPHHVRPHELPLLGFLLAPDSAQAITERFSHWMTRHKRTLITVVAGAGDAYLLVSGLTDLP